MRDETRRLLDDPQVAIRGVYLAGPSGFNDAGRLWHEEVLIPAVVAAGLIPLDPWADPSAIEEIVKAHPWGAERRALLKEANLAQGRLDLEMVDRCAAVLALLDGAQVDDGTALEIGYAHRAGKPIVGLRTDIRCAADNEGSSVNLMIETCVHDSGGIMAHDVKSAVDHVRSKLIGGATG